MEPALARRLDRRFVRWLARHGFGEEIVLPGPARIRELMLKRGSPAVAGGRCPCRRPNRRRADSRTLAPGVPLANVLGRALFRIGPDRPDRWIGDLVFYTCTYAVRGIVRGGMRTGSAEAAGKVGLPARSAADIERASAASAGRSGLRRNTGQHNLWPAAREGEDREMRSSTTLNA